MLTVQEVAERYDVSIRFMIAALDKIGFRSAKPDTPLSAVTVHHFENEWGAKIRAAARPTPERGFAGATEVVPSTQQPKPHVMRLAHAKITGTREGGFAVKALLGNPGLIHAIDAAGTRDGDPWDGEVVPGAVHFFGGPTNSGPTAACGRLHMRAVLGDEFVPNDDPAKAGQCSQCAQVVVAGRGFRNPPREYRSAFCEEYLRVRIDDKVTLKSCTLRAFHAGPHRARDDAQWEIGLDDYVPAPDELGRNIRNAP